MKIKNTINLLEIGNIKTKKQLKKYHVNTSILNGNYLFHYLIITDNLAGLKLQNYMIYRYNIDGLNGFMLSAREKKYNILDYYKNTPKYQEIFIRIFDIACEDKKLSIIKCIIDLYKKHNISFDIVRCSYNIIQLLCYYNPKNYNLQCDSDS